MKKNIFAIIFIILFGLVLAPILSQAAGLGGALGKFKEVAGTGGAGADTYEDVQGVVGAGIGAALVLVGMIFMALMVYAGYLWMTARGEEEPIKKAQNIITAALIGFFIVASAYAITTFVGGRLGGGGEGPPQTPISGSCKVDESLLSSFCKGAETDKEAQKQCYATTDSKGTFLCAWVEGLCVPLFNEAAASCESEVKPSGCVALGECKWE